MDLIVATRNRGKFAEIAEALVSLHLQLRGGFEDPDLPDCAEGTVSYEDNATRKALHYAEAAGRPALSDDSGIEVAALDGAPGVLSARFGGEDLTDGQRNLQLLEVLRDVPDDRRQARYVAVVALAAKGRILGTYRGEVAGILLREPRGNLGFGYDPLFYFPPLHLTFAQMLPAVKRQVSHRGKALALAAAALRQHPELLR